MLEEKADGMDDSSSDSDQDDEGGGEGGEEQHVLSKLLGQQPSMTKPTIQEVGDG